MRDTAPMINQGPRKWISPSEKYKIVQESFKPGVIVAEIARRYNISVSSLLRWRKLMVTAGLMSVKSNDSVVPEKDVKVLKYKIKALERMLGKKCVELVLIYLFAYKEKKL
ncbi:MAG: Transposase [Francisellaceae bacterium]|nr:Transposase [Francisellaceae bacterium]